MKLTSKIFNRKFLTQIMIAIIISVFFQIFVDPIYDRVFRAKVRSYAGYPVLLTSISQWLFSFSIAFLYYPNNKFVNNFLLSGLIPLFSVLIIGARNSVFLDPLHVTPFVVCILIMIKKRETIDKKYIKTMTPYLLSWVVVVRLLRLNYTGIPLLPAGLILIIIWGSLNILSSHYLIKDFVEPKKIGVFK